MSDLTETSLDSESVFSGRLLHVYRDQVTLPDGSTGTREWIDHPGASAVVPLFEDGTTMLIRQFRFPPRRTFMEVPAGKFDTPNESPKEVARRELKEETGLDARTLVDAGSFHPCIGYSNEVIHVFVARNLSQGEQSLSDSEFVEPVRLPFSEAVARARAGTLNDMKTITALVRAQALIEDSR